MFKKIFQKHYSTAINSIIFLHSQEISYMFSVKMRNFTICRCYPKVIVLAENRSSRTKFHSFQKLQTVRLQFLGSLHHRNREYEGRKLVGYSAEQMFDVVCDVGKYETFLPFCKRSHVLFKSSTQIKANLVIGFPPLIESYTSNITLIKPQLIKAVCTEGKLFDYLLTKWKFSPGLKNNEQTCIIDFYVSFKFRSPLHSYFANIFFNELVRQMENAFYTEAQLRYGKPAVKMQTLSIPFKNS